MKLYENTNDINKINIEFLFTNFDFSRYKSAIQPKSPNNIKKQENNE
jgi:hypothetical protein